MQNDAFISLLNPALSLVIATTFLLIWRFQPKQGHLLPVGVAFAASAVGFLLQIFILPIGFEATKLLSVALFLLSGVLMSAGITSRYGRRIPWTTLWVLGACGLSAFTWFLLVDPDLSTRIYAVNLALGGMSLAVAAELRPRAGNMLPARMLLALALLSGLNFLVRPLVTTSLGGMQPADLSGSLYWATTLLSHGVLSLLIALSLIAGAATDMAAGLRRDAHTDKLGGILNRRGFEEAASTMKESANGRSAPVSVLIADLDNFKLINDRYGHGIGDNVVVAFSTLLATAQASGGIAARLGGDEFAVILPADISIARLFAEGARTAFAGGPVTGIPATERLSVSFGIAGLLWDESISAALHRADEALYNAKRGGGNCVSIAGQMSREQPLAVACA